MSEKPRTVIIHGSYGSPQENWFPWLASQIRSLGYEAIVPSFPTPEGQSLSSWRRAFEHQVGEVTSNMIFAGHSLGPGFILDLLERSNVPVRATFLVSAFLGKLGLPDFDPINDSFVNRAFDWKKIRRNAGIVRVFNSDNDPYVPLEKGRELAEKLGTELVIISGAGHINKGSGYREIPFLLEEIKRVF